MGALAECWLTPAKPPSKNCPTTGIRTGPPRHTTPGNTSYHRLHRSVPRDKQGRGQEELRDDSNPGARPPKEKPLENSQSRDHTCVAGAKGRLAAPVGDIHIHIHFHSVFKAQYAGMSTPIDLFAFAKGEKSVPTLSARGQELELDP